VARWKELPTGEGAAYDNSVTMDAGALEPMITYGTNPGMGVPITAPLPDPAQVTDPMARDSIAKALKSWASKAETAAWAPHRRGLHRKLHQWADLRLAGRRGAAGGRKVSPKVRVLVVPGSQEVKRQAMAEGLPEIFRAAGCEWREPGCSMCIGMNPDQLTPGQYSVSTSNRNLKDGRERAGARSWPAR